MNIAVIGAARSGLAAALLAKKLNHSVFVSDSSPIEKFNHAVDLLNQKDIKCEFGQNSDEVYTNKDLLIVSPGVPPDSESTVKAREKGIPVISEIEFAWRHCKNPVIAVTGTNGKTTTTSLIEYIFNNSGKKAIAAGNIGKPFSDYVLDVSADTVFVLELSSYQLDRIDTFNPDVSLILNLTPDHLAYHKTMEAYADAKFNIAKNHTNKNLLILNNDDEILTNHTKNEKCKIAYFSKEPVGWGIYIKDGKIMINYLNKHKEEEIMLLEELSLPGLHNAYNSMAAALAARAFEITNEDIRDSLMKFEGVEHRLEFVRSIDGVDFVNDSKATNVNATWYALSSYKKPVIWIAGGRGDSNDYSNLDELVDKNIKAIVAIGEEADNIFNHYSTKIRCFRELTMEDAVQKSHEISDYGDVVLFTPACKSFDMFMNYEHRGEVFKDIVNNL